MATFVELARAGVARPEDIDDYVERWHDGDGAETLHEFLGLSVEEYGRWVREPGALIEIIGRVVGRRRATV